MRDTPSEYRGFLKSVCDNVLEVKDSPAVTPGSPTATDYYGVE